MFGFAACFMVHNDKMIIISLQQMKEPPNKLSNTLVSSQLVYYYILYLSAYKDSQSFEKERYYCTEKKKSALSFNLSCLPECMFENFGGSCL